MIRRIIEINEDKCNGCGICVDACHEGAIAMVNGKATLMRDDYCDGLGDCLPTCPTAAISFVEREAAAYDDIAVKENMRKKTQQHFSGCPGSQSQNWEHQKNSQKTTGTSQLRQWPVQIQLVPIEADYFDNAHLLIAADCAAYAYANFHQEFMHGKVTIIGCPKLDDTEYSHKLTEILKCNTIESVTVVRMEVPCCGGIEHATITALQNCNKLIPWQVVTLSLNGDILD